MTAISRCPFHHMDTDSIFGKKNMKTTHDQSGLTLLESMMGLVIFSTAIWAALSHHSTAREAQNSNQIAMEIQALKTAVHELYSGQPGYGTGSLMTSVVSSDRAPKTLSIKDGSIMNSFGGEVHLIGENASFSMEYQKISRASCIALLTGTAANGWRSVKVGYSEEMSFPITILQAKKVCTQNDLSVSFIGS